MSKKSGISFFRRLISIVLIFAATCCMILGVLQVTAGQALSRKVIRATLNQVDLQEEYGEAAAHMVNVAIKHLTGGLYVDGLYLDSDTLMECIDEKELKQFLTDKFGEFADTLTDDYVAEITSEELLPLLSGIRAHVQEKTGLTVSDEQLIREITTLMGGSVLHSITEQLVWPEYGPWLIVLGVVLLIAAFIVTWPKILWGSVGMIISFVVSAVAEWGCGYLVFELLNVDYLTEQLGATLVTAWLGVVEKQVMANAGQLLLGTILPILLIVAYYVDWKRIVRWQGIAGKE